MKVAEKYSELYDNEWTDALEELLENGANDEQGIAILLEIVKYVLSLEIYLSASRIIYNYCNNVRKLFIEI